MSDPEPASVPEAPEPRPQPQPAAGDSADAGEDRDPAVPSPLGPVTGGERIAAVDTLRGFALLGILAMNIYAFAMPFAAYGNPLAGGGTGPLDYGTWVFTHLFFDQKFMTLFSMLFGAGLVLMAGRAEQRGDPRFAGVYYRRLFWLVAIGMVHAYLIWFGDILVSYAVCGALLYPLRRRRPRTLLIVGSLMLLVALPLSVGYGGLMESTRAAAEEVAELRAAGEQPGAEALEMAEAWEQMRTGFAPSPEELAEQVAVLRGGYLGIIRQQAPVVVGMQTGFLLFFGVWRIGGLMLIGMGLMKLGIFSAARSRSFYLRCLAVGYGLGLPLVALSAQQLTAHGFDPVFIFRQGIFYNYLGSVIVAIGHIGAVMLVCQTAALPAVRSRLAAVGRMALTDYLLQSVLCTTLFYGWGFGLFGHVGRFAQMGVVLAVWAFELWLSPLWLARFRFGPAEWLWRSLTYWRRQPMRRGPEAPATAA